MGQHCSAWQDKTAGICAHLGGWDRSDNRTSKPTTLSNNSQFSFGFDLRSTWVRSKQENVHSHRHCRFGLLAGTSNNPINDRSTLQTF